MLPNPASELLAAYLKEARGIERIYRSELLREPRWRLSKDRNTPVEVLHALSHSADKGVLLNLIRNPAFPSEDAHRLRDQVGDLAAEHMLLGRTDIEHDFWEYAEKNDPESIRILLQRHSFPTDVLHHLEAMYWAWVDAGDDQPAGESTPTPWHMSYGRRISAIEHWYTRHEDLEVAKEELARFSRELERRRTSTSVGFAVFRSLRKRTDYKHDTSLLSRLAPIMSDAIAELPDIPEADREDIWAGKYGNRPLSILHQFNHLNKTYEEFLEKAAEVLPDQQAPDYAAKVMNAALNSYIWNALESTRAKHLEEGPVHDGLIPGRPELDFYGSLLREHMDSNLQILLRVYAPEVLLKRVTAATEKLRELEAEEQNTRTSSLMSQVRFEQWITYKWLVEGVSQEGGEELYQAWVAKRNPQYAGLPPEWGLKFLIPPLVKPRFY